MTPRLLDYIEGASPRLPVGDKVYTSTEYPAAYAIAMHNELSYSHTWPGKLFFCCLEAPQQGGETPLADSRKVFALLTPEIMATVQAAEASSMCATSMGTRALASPGKPSLRRRDTAVVEAYCRTGWYRVALESRWGLVDQSGAPGLCQASADR